MNKFNSLRVLFLFILIISGLGIEYVSSHGVLFGYSGSTTTVLAPVAAGQIPEIGGGTDVVGSTLIASNGLWNNAPTSFSYKWSLLGAGNPTLSTAQTYGPLTSGQIGQRLVVDVTATNQAGSTTVRSNIIGPIEAALPSPPSTGAGTISTILPKYPDNVFENGVALYTGCLPPTLPDTSNPNTVWYFDPINGHTLAQGATGHAGSPFKDAGAIFGGVQGYGSVAGLQTVGTAIGLRVTLTGTNFTTSSGRKVYINNVPVVNVISNGATSLTVDIPQMFINGTGFGASQGNGSIYINNIKVTSIISWSNTQILAYAPAGSNAEPSVGNTFVIPNNSSNLITPTSITAAITPTLANTEVDAPLFGSVIMPGSVSYVKPDPTGLLPLESFTGSNMYSTNDGTDATPVKWSWILPDPTATQMPVVSNIAINSSAGIAIQGFGVEDNSGGLPPYNGNILSVNGTAGALSHNLVFKNLSITSQLGHSGDPWIPSGYPSTGGHSDHTILTASPYMGASENPLVLPALASAGSTQLHLTNGIPNLTTAGNNIPEKYVFSPGYYYQIQDPQFPVYGPSNTGIPNGTTIQNINGRTDLYPVGLLDAATDTEVTGGTASADTVNQISASALGGNTITGTVTSVGSLPATGGGIITLNSAIVSTSIISGHTYKIVNLGNTTNWNSIGDTQNNPAQVGDVFTATGAGNGNGTVGGFLAAQGTGSIKINGVSVTTINSWSASQIVAVLPVTATGPTAANSIVTLDGQIITVPATSISVALQYYVVQPSTTATQSLYLWCVAPTAITCPVTSLWALVGTFLPSAASTIPEYYTVQPNKGNFGSVYQWLFTITAATGSNYGNGQASFTINGSGFGTIQFGPIPNSSGSVTINGVSMTSITSWSDTSITGLLPFGSVAPTIGNTVVNNYNNGTGTITGVSSTSPGTVKINGIPVTSISSWSTNTITGVVPSGAPNPTAGNVVVTPTGGGTPATANASVSWILLGSILPTISTATANVSQTWFMKNNTNIWYDKGTSAGASFILTGTGFGSTQGSGSLTVGGVAVTSISSWADNKITGTIPAGAATPTTSNSVVTPTSGNAIVFNVGGIWGNLGAATVNLTTCDGTADAATGCPSTLYPGLVIPSNVPGCDPKVDSSGGCPAGTPPAWSGTTRALTEGIGRPKNEGEYVFFVPYIVEPPSGYWNNVDWAWVLNGANFVGAQGTNNADPSNPNDVTGTSCITLQDSLLRETENAIAFSNMANGMAYGNKIKFRTSDAIDIYSAHRNIVMFNFSSDATYQRAHPDMVQFAQAFGTEASLFIGNVVVDNEFYTHSDPNDQFPDFSQGIGVTDGIYPNTYIANNIMFNSDNPLAAAGTYNVVVNNDVFMDTVQSAGAVRIASGNKALKGLAAHSLMSNNISNAITVLGSPASSTSCTVDGNSVLGNMMLPVMNWTTGIPTTGNATFCGTPVLGSGYVNGTYSGLFADHVSWSPIDWRTEVAGITSPFTEVHLLTPSSAGLLAQAATNPCIQNEFYTGFCPSSGTPGTLNLRPNNSFSGTPINNITCSSGTQSGGQCIVNNINLITTTGIVGDTWMLTSSSTCANGFNPCAGFINQTFPAGLYRRINLGTTVAAYGAVASPFSSGVIPFTPAVIGGGVNLGAQAPIANHARQPLASTPNIGAY